MMAKDDRDEKVIAILRTSSLPLGPTEIARRIGEAWCGGLSHQYPSSSAIMPVLRRIGAVKEDGVGRYSLPDAEITAR